MCLNQSSLRHCCVICLSPKRRTYHPSGSLLLKVPGFGLGSYLHAKRLLLHTSLHLHYNDYTNTLLELLFLRVLPMGQKSSCDISILEFHSLGLHSVFFLGGGRGKGKGRGLVAVKIIRDTAENDTSIPGIQFSDTADDYASILGIQFSNAL